MRIVCIESEIDSMNSINGLNEIRNTASVDLEIPEIQTRLRIVFNKIKCRAAIIREIVVVSVLVLLMTIIFNSQFAVSLSFVDVEMMLIK